MTAGRRSSKKRSWFQSIKKQVDSDLKRAKKVHLSWKALLLLSICMVPLCFLFDHFGKLDLAMPVATCVMAIGFAIAIRWDLRHRVWFWITILLIGAMHVAVICSVPWTDKWHPGAMYGGIASLDVCAIFVILALLENLLGGEEAVSDCKNDGLRN